MTSEGLQEMFEGDFSDLCSEKFDRSPWATLQHAQTGNDDPHGFY